MESVFGRDYGIRLIGSKRAAVHGHQKLVAISVL